MLATGFITFMTAPPTIHGSAVVYNRFGILVLGASGSGKSTLINRLIEHGEQQNVFCRWVGDDRLRVEQQSQKIIVRPAEAIQGLSERYHLGIERVRFVESAAIDLVVELKPKVELERLPDLSVHGEFPAIPSLAVGERDASAAISLILARITAL